METGSVWEDEVYSDDSSIRRAALHAGALSADGGVVTVQLLPGRSSYPAISRNGVASGSWGQWPGSFAVGR